jgi:DNA-binding SARP family transcriptional activator
MAHLSLYLLGPFQATLDGVPIAGFESSKVRALLAYLAVEAHRRPGEHSRQALAGLLWPDKPERAALANLRNALSNLRKAIGDRSAIGDRDASPPYLKITRETIQFNLASDHWLDVAAFSAAFQASVETAAAERSTRQRLQEAAALSPCRSGRTRAVCPKRCAERWPHFLRGGKNGASSLSSWLASPNLGSIPM